MKKKSLLELFKTCDCGIEYKNVGDCVSYAFKEDGSHLEIYFQGSSQIADWVRNFLFKKKPYKDMEIPYKVHGGFLAAWKEVKDVIKQKIEEKNENGKFKFESITVIGYSHGGALAALCHEFCWFWRKDIKDNLFGFGFEAPRIYGGFKVKKELKERWEHFTVIRTNNDLVTHCPPIIFGYCHVGTMLKVKGDTKLVKNKLPQCVQSHFPATVRDALEKFSRDYMI